MCKPKSREIIKHRENGDKSSAQALIRQEVDLSRVISLEGKGETRWCQDALVCGE